MSTAPDRCTIFAAHNGSPPAGGGGGTDMTTRVVAAVEATAEALG